MAGVTSRLPKEPTIRRLTLTVAVAVTVCAASNAAYAATASSNPPTKDTGSAPAPTPKPSARHYTNEQIIRQVFGRYGDQAVRVAYCESRLSIWAHNGQYLGLFQMGYSERAHYGHSWDAWGQARAAYRYFVASGRNWGPWQCKPW